MPQSEVELSRDGGRELSDVAEARQLIAGRALRPGQVGTVGLELEGHLIDRRDPARRVPWTEISRLRAMTPTLPRGSLLSVEPGGQLELSTLPAVDIAAAVRALQADQRMLAAMLRDRRLRPGAPRARPGPARRCGSIRPRATS